MEKQTICLLDECNSGCKMAIQSMEQIKEYITDKKLLQIIDSYTQKHRELEKETSLQLEEYGKMEKEPGVMATAMSWITTEVKMHMNNDNSQIAKLMMNGCNMGIQSISQCINKNQTASEKSIQLAKRLVKTEEDFMGEMKSFL